MLVYFAIVLVALLGFCGLAVDLGRMELRSLELQSAADAGALSGAAEWAQGNSGVSTAAYNDALAAETLNGYPKTTAITTQFFPTSGPYATNYATVQTTITQSVPTVFLKLLPGGATAAAVTVRAVALAPPCMYFFGNPVSNHAGAGIDLSSAGIRNACPLYTKPKPYVDGFSSVYNNQVETSVAGSGNVNGGGGTYPVPFYNFPVQSDPLAYVVAPSYTGCDYVGMTVIVPVVLQPGRYCGGLLNAPGLTVAGTTVTMAPGLYVFTNGVNFTNATINGSGVTLYLTKGGVFGNGTFREVNSLIRLTAPTDASAGGLTGITLFADRNWVGGNEDLQFQSGSWYGDGIIYSMKTGMNLYNINFAAPHYMNMVVANEDSYLGTIYASANYSTVAGGNPLHNAVSLVQ